MITKMCWKLEFITKEVADELLKHNHLNRPVRRKIDKIKQDLVHGCFQLTHQGIAIAEDGELVDGQHRLIAISETGIPAWLWVCYNAPKSTKIDRGSMRTDREALYMAGEIEKGSIAWNNMTLALVSFILGRNPNGGFTRSSVTEDGKLNVYKKFSNLIDPIVSMTTMGNRTGAKCRSSIVLYGMMCALNSGVNIEKIRKWYQILMTGDFYSEIPEELLAGRGVLVLKNILDSNYAAIAHTSKEAENQLLGKIETSILHFSNEKEVKQIKGTIVFNEIQVTQDDLYGR